MSRWLLMWIAAAALLAPVLAAQEPVASDSTILVLRQDSLFDDSSFGRASRERIEAASRELAAENRRIEAALEAEERDLTERRATLASTEFRAFADAFNERVEGIRGAQDAKSRNIARQRDEDRQRFFKAAVPVLASIMREKGALVILDRQAVVLSFDVIDVTGLAIERIDAEIGDGSEATPPSPEDVQSAAPESPAPGAPQPSPAAP